jgi:hypothetical protein
MVPFLTSRRIRAESSDWWALNREMTALSSRDFLASLACRAARMDRQKATPAAEAAITAEAMASPLERMPSVPMSWTPRSAPGEGERRHPTDFTRGGGCPLSRAFLSSEATAVCAQRRRLEDPP